MIPDREAILNSPLTEDRNWVVRIEGPAEHARNALALLYAAEPSGTGPWLVPNETFEAVIARLWKIVRQAENRA